MNLIPKMTLKMNKSLLKNVCIPMESTRNIGARISRSCIEGRGC